MKQVKFNKGLLAIMIVLFSIPLGHTLMVLNDNIIGYNKYQVAGLIGTLGIILLFIGIKLNHLSVQATILGFLGGILVWTGWIEFSFVWVAEKLKVAPLMENNEIATRSEYLVMMSSVGLLSAVIFIFLFTDSRCKLFIWWQKLLRLRQHIAIKQHKRPAAVVTFFETIMVFWTFYLLLLFVYDEQFAGSKHWLTYLVAFGSLFWSLILCKRLLKIQQLDFALKYAIPTVVIFWNFIEILGRWHLLEEIWIAPFDYWLENSLILGIFSFFIIRALLLKNKRKPRLTA
jgi:hypothetical protein